MDGGGAGGLGWGPFLPLFKGTEAPILKLVPAVSSSFTDNTSYRTGL